MNTTFATVLADLVRRDPGRPLVTFYDHATGERTELSVVTYANWVAKTASLLVEELDLERGQTVRLDLPVHWLGPVVLGAAWTVGLVVTESDDADLVCCGPATVERWGAEAADRVVLASALHPMGQRFADPLPAGVHDLGVEVWSQPDSFAAYDPPGPEDPATRFATGSLTHAAMCEAATAGSLLADGGRLLSEANPASPSGLASFTEPLVRGGSVVLVAHPDPDRVQQTYDAERATARA